MNDRNLICGRKPTFGDKEQIAYIQKMDGLFSGRDPVIFSIDVSEDDQGFEIDEWIIYSFFCIKCGSENIFKYEVDRDLIMQSYIDAAWTFEKDCKCRKCNHKYYFDIQNDELYYIENENR